MSQGGVLWAQPISGRPTTTACATLSLRAQSGPPDLTPLILSLALAFSVF
jgi:hypothetical protein